MYFSDSLAHNVLDHLHFKRSGLRLRLRRTKGSEPQLRRADREAVSEFVGMDVHKATIAVSVADAGGGETRFVVWRLRDIASEDLPVPSYTTFSRGRAELLEVGTCPNLVIYRRARYIASESTFYAPFLRSAFVCRGLVCRNSY